MSPGLSQISVSEFTRRMIERAGAGNWFLLVAVEDDVLQLAEEVAYGLTQEADEGEVVEVDRPAKAYDVVKLARRKRTLVLAGLESWPSTEWARWDVLRSRLLPSHKVAFVLSSAAASRLFSGAPHFIRLFSGSVWAAKPEGGAPNDAERARLLASLERWGGMSTAEMVRRAEAGQLPTNPEYTDWVVLAGRSDLL